VNPHCKIVIPDTGPLLSLDRADALWLLTALKMEICVPLTVLYEVQALRSAKYANSPAYQRIYQFLKDNDTVFEGTDTSYNATEIIENILGIKGFLQRSGERLSTHERFEIEKTLEDDIKTLKHAGERSIFEVLDKYYSKQKISSDKPALILYEDRDAANLLQDLSLKNYGRMLPAHLLSTASFLMGMEKLGFIQSAEDLMKKMGQRGDIGELPRTVRLKTDIAAPDGSEWRPDRELGRDDEIDECARIEVQEDDDDVVGDTLKP
jgi:hypothetical protein